MVSTKAPVLFIVFNRPHKTKEVLQKISQYKPEKLYISSDSARVNNAKDIENCNLVQKLINDGITWPCTVLIKKYTENQGCKLAVSQALTWFFDHEPYGVILEDDCVPDLSFFDFALELLQKYENDKRVFSISGYSFGYKIQSGESYLFSRYMNMWGWASWRRVSVQVDYNLTKWNALSKRSKRLFLFKHFSLHEGDFDYGWMLYWEDLFNQIVSGRVNTWDFQWFYLQFLTSALTIFPSVNLIQNIGFDNEATFTSDKHYLKYPSERITFPLIHPKKVVANKIFATEIIKKIWAQYEKHSIAWHLRTTKFYIHVKTTKLFKVAKLIVKGR